jgi:hypothetical protein
MTLLLREGTWDDPTRGPGPLRPPPPAGKAAHRGWMQRLHVGHSGHEDRAADADAAADNQREKDAGDASASPEIEPSRGKKHRFSLSRLFRPEDRHGHHHGHHHGHQQDNQAGEDGGDGKRSPCPQARASAADLHRVAPLEIPPLLLMNEKNGGVTVSGRRVPFTRAAHQKKRRMACRPLPRIAEDRALGQTSSAASIDAYRRRAYYAAKPKDKDKPKDRKK